MTITVVLVDDHILVRQGVAHLLQTEPGLSVVGQASTIAEGRQAVARYRPNVMITDVSMPDGSGLDLVRSARDADPTLGIIVLTMHGDDATLLGSLDAGASAVVPKSMPAEEIIDAVRRAATAPGAFTATGLAAALRRRRATEEEVPLLTPREREVLTLLVGGSSVGKVARQLYMSESTVKTHVGRVYEKLGVNNRASAVMSAVQRGLVDVQAAASRAG